MTAVSNSSPLIYLAALSDFELLPRLFGNVKVPSAVWREVVEQGEAYPVCVAVRGAIGKWLEVVPVQIDKKRITDSALHAGEAESILLAEQCRADVVLMDDRRAVRYARERKLRVVTTVGIYVAAKRAGVIPSIKGRVDELRKTSFRLSDSDYEAVLTAAGEWQ